MGRKKKEEEHENHERWMVSYADFLTLLFAFFTCLYAISTVDAQKMGKMVASMKASFGGEVFDVGSNTLTLDDGGGGGTSVSSEILKNPEVKTESDLNGLEAKKSQTDKSSSKTILNGDAAMGRFKRTIEAMLGEEIKNNMVRVRMERRGVVISLGETGMFDSGSIDIKPQGLAMLDAIATSLTTVANQIRIEGHADNIPINTPRFPSNWELSCTRATAVLNRMVTNYGMSQELMIASGYGEWRPVAPNDTAEGRARNRRVDIVVLNPAFGLVEPLS
jgi:chemotaxis protein MotB